MGDMGSIPNTIDTHRAPSLADAEAKLRRLTAALNEFADQLAAMPRSARRLADACDETLNACPPEMARMSDVLRVLSACIDLCPRHEWRITGASADRWSDREIPAAGRDRLFESDSLAGKSPSRQARRGGAAGGAWRRIRRFGSAGRGAAGLWVNVVSVRYVRKRISPRVLFSVDNWSGIGTAYGV
jgi:hypothetical protein